MPHAVLTAQVFGSIIRLFPTENHKIRLKEKPLSHFHCDDANFSNNF